MNLWRFGELAGSWNANFHPGVHDFSYKEALNLTGSARAASPLLSLANGGVVHATCSIMRATRASVRVFPAKVVVKCITVMTMPL